MNALTRTTLTLGIALGASPLVLTGCSTTEPEAVVVTETVTATTNASPTGTSAPTRPTTVDATVTSVAQTAVEPVAADAPTTRATAATTPAASGGVPSQNEAALRSAENYNSLMPFSQQGLYDQLIYEGYTAEQAQYGASNVRADWYANALRDARQYQETMPMSEQRLYEQLVYEGYTNDQATYALTNLY